MSSLLEAVDVTSGYGTTTVIRDVSISVSPGEVVALMGPNGAGKTATLLTLAGELIPTAGEVRLRGEPTSAPLYERARAGLGFVTEERACIMSLDVRDNFRLAGVTVDRALSLFPALEPHLDRRAGLLSGGQQQMLSLARALGRDPEVLLADELSLGLAPVIVDDLLRAVRAAADSGVGVVLVEQHVSKALRIADRVVIMRRGRLVADLVADDVRQDRSAFLAEYFAA